MKFPDLMKWYVSRCNRVEGQKKQMFLIDPRKYGLVGNGWDGKDLRVTIEPINKPEPEISWVMMYLRK
jgi:hypothetical protein